MDFRTITKTDKVVVTLLNYAAWIPTYQFAAIKHGQYKDYYDDKCVDIHVEDLSLKEDYTLDIITVPVTRIVELYPITTKYRYTAREDWDFREWLFNWLRINFKMKFYCYIYHSVKIFRKEMRKYYLSSRLMDNEIVLINEEWPKKYVIDDYKYIKWAENNILNVEWLECKSML